MKRLPLFAAPALLALVSACGDADEPEVDTTEQGGEAEGDVLGGSISDDMLPLEELQSQSPPASRSEDTDDSDAEE